MPQIPSVFRMIIVSAYLLFSSLSGAADITLHASAIDTALKTEVFTKDGKYFFSGGPKSCSYASLESPATSLRDGRMFVRVRFAGRAGVASASQCVGRDEAFWLTVSGRPSFQGEVLGITEIRLEEGNAVYGPLLESFLASIVPSALNLNLRRELMKMLTNAPSPYNVSLPRLELQGVTAESNALKVVFDFSLEGR